MRLFRPCFFAQWLYRGAIFRIKTTEKILYLTFDDGPDPGSTPPLLDILDAYNVKAQFFCSGAAAEKYPGLIENIKSKGHLLGNHGFNHPSGWSTSTNRYLSDVSHAAEFISSVFFRPPYGRLRLKQFNLLKGKYKIVFWDLMPFDFDVSFGRDKSLRILKRNIRKGSIIVLHDSPRSNANIILEEFLVIARDEDYRFELLQIE